MEKIDSCNGRSIDKVAGKVKVCNCGTTKDVEDYKCERRDIFPVAPQICNDCLVYQPK